jgi:NAD(P)-dependent dehydrogenase (short-subunit alcohol dehydrogenase family)
MSTPTQTADHAEEPPPRSGVTTGIPESRAAEIARLAMFLTTPAARHITGQTLHVTWRFIPSERGRRGCPA